MYQPKFHYWLLEEGRVTLPQRVIDSDNLMSILVQFEQVEGPHEALYLVDHLARILRAEKGSDSLIRAFGVYLTNTLKTKELHSNIHLQDIREGRHMLRERVEMWTQEWMEQGWQKGLSQGVAQGERAIIERQLLTKFGKLPPIHQQKLASMTENDLLQISDIILYAKTLSDVFGHS
jgi:hypothetical protein